VIAAVLTRHTLADAEKFIQEVFWRSYWKGWLEMRPRVLARFDTECLGLEQAWAGDAGLRRAMDARTGIACFDAWVRELLEIGWLHNHARMWFASIWIFTLHLPWQLGAAFFFRHLLDADPASNTLSWRWVAGLHTRGKHYLARAANIRDNTLGRFYPKGDLDEGAPPLPEDVGAPEPHSLQSGDAVKARRVALLIHEDDLNPETWAFTSDVAGCAGLSISGVFQAHNQAARFSSSAIEDGIARAGAHFATHAELLEARDIARWARGLGVDEVVTGYAPVGPTARLLESLQGELADAGLRLVRLQRRFDVRAWPHARAGFFKLKEKIPALIMGIS
jgi:deoxyribodipyrimidine photo-lyase